MSKGGRPKKAPDEKRNVRVGCRLTDGEVLLLDKRRGKVSRGEYLRRAAFENAPRPVPKINRQAWSDLGRSLGNLSTLAVAMRGGAYAELQDVEKVVRDVRLKLIGK